LIETLKTRRKGAIVAAACLALASLAATVDATAQTSPYPAKPVRIINPYSPGGSTDAVLRPLTERLLAITG
jgi:tripartite-type tricarboxylate transporter receptor subunit TctC